MAWRASCTRRRRVRPRAHLIAPIFSVAASRGGVAAASKPRYLTHARLRNGKIDRLDALPIPRPAISKDVPWAKGRPDRYRSGRRAYRYPPIGHITSGGSGQVSEAFGAEKVKRRHKLSSCVDAAFMRPARSSRKNNPEKEQVGSYSDSC